MNQESEGRVLSADGALLLVGSGMGKMEIFEYTFNKSCRPREKSLRDHHNHHVLLILQGDEENFLNS